VSGPAAPRDRADLDRKVDRGTAWIGISSLTSGLFDLFSTLAVIWLWVSPSDFGAATLAIALFPILDRLGGLCLGAAVIARAGQPDGDATDDAAFWLGLGAATLLLGALFAVRPLLADFFPQPVVASLLCAYGGKLVFQNVFVVPEAHLRRAMRYRELSMIRVAAVVADTAAKLGAAYLGAHGHPPLAIWCFVIGPLANVVVTAIGVQLRCPWRPRARLDRAVAARTLRFGGSIAGGELLYFLYTSADYLVIGRAFGDAAVGIYRLAYELVLDVVRLISLITAEVAFPAFVELQADRPRVARQLVRFTRQNLIALAPFLAFVLASAPELLRVLYPPLGGDAATAVRVLCTVGTLRTLSFVMTPMLGGIGLPQRALAYNVIAAIVLPAAFVAAAAIAPDAGYVAVAWGWAAGYPIAFAALLGLALPPIELSLGGYLRPLAGVTACAAVAMGAAFGVRELLPDVAIARVAAAAITTIAVYAALLARVAGVTPRGIVRALRGEVDPATS
jgi:O-antigen/teichoic acid export membrane protein